MEENKSRANNEQVGRGWCGRLDDIPPNGECVAQLISCLIRVNQAPRRSSRRWCGGYHRKSATHANSSILTEDASMCQESSFPKSLIFIDLGLRVSHSGVCETRINASVA